MFNKETMPRAPHFITVRKSCHWRKNLCNAIGSNFVRKLTWEEMLKQIKIFFISRLIRNNYSECNINCIFLSHQSLNAEREHLVASPAKQTNKKILCQFSFSWVIVYIILSPALLCGAPSNGPTYSIASKNLADQRPYLAQSNSCFVLAWVLPEGSEHQYKTFPASESLPSQWQMHGWETLFRKSY